MKPFWLWLGLSLCAGPLLAQSPVLHLKMDRESAAPRIRDHSRSGLRAELVGGLRFVPDRFGNGCRAIRFDGDGYLRLAHDDALNLPATFTTSVWVNLANDNWSQGLQWLTLVCKGETPDERPNSPAFRVQLTSGTASVNTASTKSIGTIQQVFPVNRWFHVALVYDGQRLTTYLDGRVYRSFALRDPIAPNREALNIGRDIPGNTELFVGTMDELKLFDRALRPQEVLALAQDDRDRKLGSACPAPPPPPPAQPSPPPPPASQAPPVPTPDWGAMTPAQPQPSAPPQPANPKPQPLPATPAPVASTPLPAPEPGRPTALAPTQPDDPYDFTGQPANNLVLLLDVSGSMNRAEKLPLLKAAFLDLVPNLRTADLVSVVTYAGGTKVLLDGVPATQSGKIARKIDKLDSNGKTRADKGLKKALRIARKHQRAGDNTRIILATDGKFDLDQLDPLVAELRSAGVALSIFSFGLKSAQDQAQLDELARRGQGNHQNIRPENVAEALLGEVRE